MRRQDEDTDNDPAGTDGDGDDSMKQYEEPVPQGPPKSEKVSTRQNQTQLNPKLLSSEIDCDMDDEGNAPEKNTKGKGDKKDNVKVLDS